MEKLPNNERTIKEWLFGESTPKTKSAVERIFNNNSDLTESMIDFINEAESEQIKKLISEYVEIVDGGLLNQKTESKTRMKVIENEFAEILETAFDRGN